MVGLIAHEYAHSWQWQGDNFNHELLANGEIPFEGKLFVEGFAMWVEFKVLDFYGLTQTLDQIKEFSTNEYRDGFHVVQQIEDELGFQGVFSFVKNGPLEYKGGLVKLYADAGFSASSLPPRAEGG